MGYKLGYSMGTDGKLLRHIDQYLKQRGGRWYYVRRVPGAYDDLDNRGTIRTSLRTGALEVARVRRDALAEADNLYWASLSSNIPELSEKPSASAL